MDPRMYPTGNVIAETSKVVTTPTATDKIATIRGDSKEYFITLANLFASPPAFGGTTPSAGNFSTITASSTAAIVGNVTVSTGNLVVTAGDATVTAGALTVTAGDLAVTAGKATSKGSFQSPQVVTTNEAINADVSYVEIANATPATIIALTIAAPAAGRLLVITQTGSGTSDDTVTLSSGTYNGSGTIATFNAKNETLVLFGIAADRFAIVENIGSIAIS